MLSDWKAATSPFDRQVLPAGVLPGLGIEMAMADDGADVVRTFDGSPAVSAGVAAGDRITHVDGAALQGIGHDAMLAMMWGAVKTRTRLTIQRNRQDSPVDVTIVPNMVDIVLQVRCDAGKLTVEATGAWPVLEFAQGTQVALAALSSAEFIADSDDRSRVVFVRGTAGRVSGLVLNPGPWEQRGVKIA
jgi:C-terminal processing protease CtpA/Prc